MKKEYSMLISMTKRKNLSKYVFVLFLFLMAMICLSFLPVRCEPITGGYVMLKGKKVGMKKCYNIYGTEISIAEYGE